MPDRTLRDAIGGIDEAGRGPMFGPMVVCGILVDERGIDDLVEVGVRDSKALSPLRREQLARSIRECALEVEYMVIPARVIDERKEQRKSLNDIEIEAFSSIAGRLRPKVLYVDAADVKPQRFGETVGMQSGLSELDCEIISEHKADEKYPIVSAASILAKVRRDSIIQEFHEQYGDFGSGYPSDPKSVAFLENLLSSEEDLPSFIRRTWKSVVKRVRKSAFSQDMLDI